MFSILERSEANMTRLVTSAMKVGGRRRREIESDGE